VRAGSLDAAGPERLNRITVRVGDDDPSMAWDTREELLRSLAEVPAGGAAAVARLRAVGATRPVELTLADESAVLPALELWRARTPESPDFDAASDRVASPSP
jgi:hypothetical protein